MRERLASLVAVGVFPLVFGGAVVWTLASIQGGRDPAEATALPVLTSGTIVAVLERFFPHHRSWLHSHGDILVDLSHGVSVALTTSAVTALLLLIGIPIAASLAGSVGLGLWPATSPLLLQLVLALVVAELPKYWLHRLMHEHDALWRLHATHHSAPRLYFLNATRFHPFDIGLDTVAGLFPLIVLGAGAPVLALFTLVSAVHGFFQHANLRLHLGPLNYVFSMAELHRWHHSKTVREANHNYGQNVIVWDLVFGTFFWPKDREPPEAIGIPDLSAFPMSYLAQLLSPFRWRRIQQASRGRVPATRP